MTLKQEPRVPFNGINGQTKMKLDSIGRWNNITKTATNLSIRETKMAGIYKKNPIISRPISQLLCNTETTVVKDAPDTLNCVISSNKVN
jgi:hypothetical protein